MDHRFEETVIDELLDEIEAKDFKEVEYTKEILMVIRGLMKITGRIKCLVKTRCASTRRSVNPKQTDVIVFTL